MLVTPDPTAFDRGLAPFEIPVNLKAAHESLGKRESLDGLTVGVPLAVPGLRAVSHPQQARFAIYDVPDDIAARFDCASRLTPGAPTKASREYGQHSGASFRIAGTGKDTSVALLWAKENGLPEDRAVLRLLWRKEEGTGCEGRQFSTIRCVTTPSTTGRTENTGFRRISAVT